MERLRHLRESVNDQIDFASLHVEKADIRGIHDIECDARRLLTKLFQYVGEQGGFGVVTGHQSDHTILGLGDKLFGGLQCAVDVRQNLA